MKYNELGKTGIKVSRLCFGGLTVGPLQKNMTPEEGGKIIKYAFDRGVNFIDTAQLYKTYPHIREGLKHFNRHDYVIASKSYAYDKKTALESVEEALRELNTDYIDIFMLHEQESEHTLRGHYEALETFIRLKEKGIIRAVGLSTHAVAGVKAAIMYDEIEVIHPILNVSGLGIIDGSRDEMLGAIQSFKGGVYSMKPLGGGNLLNRVEDSFDYILNQEGIDSIAVGMQNYNEIDYNIKRFSGQSISDALKEDLRRQPRQLKIADWCVNCEKCIEKCGQKALIPGETRPIILKDKCVLCGYCASVCEDFCIKVV
jgi:aryl-alcohol dehydrogenase-like predicted oxidoreductase